MLRWAADVSGHVNGLRKKVIHEESRIIYVPFKGHELNLIVLGALKSSNDVKNEMKLA